MGVFTHGACIYLSKLSGGHVVLTQAPAAGGKGSGTSAALLSGNLSGAWNSFVPDGLGLLPEAIGFQQIYTITAELP